MRGGALVVVAGGRMVVWVRHEEAEEHDVGVEGRTGGGVSREAETEAEEHRRQRRSGCAARTPKVGRAHPGESKRIGQHHPVYVVRMNNAQVSQ